MKKFNIKIVILIFSILIGIFTIYFIFEKQTPHNVKVTQEIKSIYQYSKKATSFYPNIKLLRSGDIILRRGYGVDSIVAANFSNKEKRYSHAGIIYKDKNNIYVIHSEDNKRKGFNGVVKEKLQNYLKGIKIWAVYMYDNINVTKLTTYILKEEQSNILFDMEFDLKTNKKMYCSEFIYKSFNKVSQKKLIKASKLFLSKRYVVITDLYLNKNTKLIDISHKTSNP